MHSFFTIRRSKRYNVSDTVHEKNDISSCIKRENKSQEGVYNEDKYAIENEDPRVDGTITHQLPGRKRKLDDDVNDTFMDNPSFCEYQLKVDVDDSEEEWRKIEDDQVEFHTQTARKDIVNTKDPAVVLRNDHSYSKVEFHTPPNGQLDGNTRTCVTSQRNNHTYCAMSMIDNGPMVSPSISKRTKSSETTENNISKGEMTRDLSSPSTMGMPLVRVKANQKLYSSGSKYSLDSTVSPNALVSQNIMSNNGPIPASKELLTLDNSNFTRTPSTTNKNTNMISSKNLPGSAARVIVIPRSSVQSKVNSIPQMIHIPNSYNLNDQDVRQLKFVFVKRIL